MMMLGSLRYAGRQRLLFFPLIRRGKLTMARLECSGIVWSGQQQKRVIGRPQINLRFLSTRSRDDAYSILGVPRGRTDRDYKVAYLQKAKTCHPDLHPNNPEATAKFQELSAAYESIKTAKARDSYDNSRQANQWTGRQGYTREEAEAAAAATWAEAFADAEAIFTAGQSWWKDEVSALEDDLSEFTTAVSTRRLGDAYVIAQKRAGLVLGVAIPLLLILRWPAAALALLRGAVPLITFLIGSVSRIVMRNPRLLPVLAGFLHRFAATGWRRMAARARERMQKDQAEAAARNNRKRSSSSSSQQRDRRA